MLSLLLDVCLFLGTLRALLLQAWMRHESGYGCLIFFYGCAWDTEQYSSWCPKSWNRQDDILRLLWSRTECVSLWEMLGHWGLASYSETLNKNKPISVMNNEITSTLWFFAACFSGLTLYCLSLGCLAAMSLDSVSYSLCLLLFFFLVWWYNKLLEWLHLWGLCHFFSCQIFTVIWLIITQRQPLLMICS